MSDGGVENPDGGEGEPIIVVGAEKVKRLPVKSR